MKLKKLATRLVEALSVVLLFGVMAGLNGVSAQSPVDYDADDDGLIEITYIEQLNAISWDLDGDGVANNAMTAGAYNAEFSGALVRMGCPKSGCKGYELTRDLNFNDPNSYASGAVNGKWTSGNGWLINTRM